MKKFFLLVVLVFMMIPLFGQYIYYNYTLPITNDVDLNLRWWHNSSSEWYNSGYVYLTATFMGAYSATRTFTFDEFSADPEGAYSEYEDWLYYHLNRIIGSGFNGGGPVSVGSATSGTADQIVAPTINTFQNVIFAAKVQPRVSQKSKEKEGDGETKPKPNDFTSDLQYETFSIDSADGTSLTIRGGLERFNYDMNMSFGGNLNINSLSFDGGADYSNIYLGLFTKKTIKEEANSDMNLGINLDVMMFDKDYIDETGFGVSTFIAGNNYKGISVFNPSQDNHLFSWGGMYTFIKVDKLSQHLLNAGTSYGIPIGEKMTGTFDLFGTYYLASYWDGEEIDIDDNMMLNTGFHMGYMVSPVFNLTLGLKKVFLIEDFSSTEIAVGGSYRF